jgi:hypothetical protein
VIFYYARVIKYLEKQGPHDRRSQATHHNIINRVTDTAPVLPSPALPYPALPCPALLCPALFCPALYHPCHYVLKFFLQITTMLHGQHTFQLLLFRFTQCYMESPYFNIFSSDFGHDRGTVYFSTFTLQIPAMLHGQSAFEYLVCRFLSC